MSIRKDWSTDERKLQSVYDDISSNRYKLAYNQVERFWKKQPKSQPALILKAFLLNKLGYSTKDVMKVWKGVEQTGELSPRSMWWAQLLMRNIGRSDILLGLYVRLWDSRPESMELGHQVVVLSTACWDTAIMCSSARKMFNLSKTATWARVAAWAEWVDKTATQVHPEHGFSPPAPSNSLRTATVLLSTTRKEVTSSEILWLHVQILLGAGQEEEAVKLVRREGVAGGGVARGWWRIKTVQEVLRRLADKGDIDGLHKLVEEELEDFGGLLREDQDMQRNWANYEHIIHLLGLNPVSEHITKTKELFDSLHEQIGGKERAPALASLYLDGRLRDANADQTHILEDGAYRQAIEAYWARWGSKGVVMEDLAGQWKGRESPLATPLQQWAEEQPTDLNGYLAGKHARLLLFRLKAGGWIPTEDEFKDTWANYLAGTRYGSILPDTDVRPADEIGIAAVQILIHLWHCSKAETDGEEHLFRAVLCLRHICEQSPSSALARYLLIRLYRLLGAPSLVVKPLEDLKLAEIQLDTLLHIVSEQASIDTALGQTTAVFDLYKERAEYMYSKTAMDLPEYMKQALENESYSQISSIRKLQSTLATSLPAAILAIESQRMTIGSGSKEVVELSADLTRALDEMEAEDTRDWALMPTLVGDRPIQDVMSLGGKMTRRWVQSWRSIGQALEAVRAEPSTELPKSLPSMEAVSPPERAMLEDSWTAICGVHPVVQSTATAGGPSKGETPLNGTSSKSLASIGNANIHFATSAPRCRWEKFNTSMLLLQFSRIIDILISRIDDIVKPKGKNKKAAPNPAVQGVAKELKSIQERLKDGMKRVAASLERLDWEDECADWVKLGDGLVPAQLAESVGKEVVEARRTATDNLGRLLNDKR